MEATTHTPEQLIQMLANATVTYYRCSGHNKADMNKMRVEKYKNQMEELGYNIPTYEELLKIGEFNGEGSY